MSNRTIQCDVELKPNISFNTDLNRAFELNYEFLVLRQTEI